LPIIETTASIRTKFCTLLKTTKYHSWAVQTSRTSNPRWRTAAILEIEKSRYLGNGQEIDRQEIWYGDANWPF